MIAHQHAPPKSATNSAPRAPGHQSRKTAPSAPNCMAPSTLSSISQITVPSLLEVRTPIDFCYLGISKQALPPHAATISCFHLLTRRPPRASMGRWTLKEPKEEPRWTVKAKEEPQRHGSAAEGCGVLNAMPTSIK